MSRLKENDEQEALKLDSYFKTYLESARPYILRLVDCQERHLCQAWLQKLSCASNQRSLRNRYLLDFLSHLKSGHIGGIFSKPPPAGPLPNLPRIYDHDIDTSTSLSEISDIGIRLCNNHPGSMMKHKKPFVSSDHSTDSDSTSVDEQIVESSAKHYCPNAKRIENANRSQILVYNTQIDDLRNVIHDLQIENEHLKENLSYVDRACNCNENSKNLNSTVDELTLEITSLRTKLVEVNDMKDSLQRNHEEIVEQYKTTMAREFEKLHVLLAEAHSKNEEMDKKVATIQSQLEGILCEREDEKNTIKQDFDEKIKKARNYCETSLAEKDSELQLKDEIISEKNAELSSQTKLHKEEIAWLNNTIQELENKLKAKIEDESDLQAFLKEQCSTVKEEFAKMRSEMEIATQTMHQTLLDKNSALKRMILKITKSKDKMCMEFEHKFADALQKKDLEINNLRLQLREQHSELSTSLSTAKQCELDNLLRLLEERYKGLLAATDQSAGNQREHFLKKITFLENQVSCMKNNLVENDLYV